MQSGSSEEELTPWALNEMGKANAMKIAGMNKGGIGLKRLTDA